MLHFLPFLFALLPAVSYAEEGATGNNDSGFWSTLWGYLDTIIESISSLVKWLSDLVVQVFVALFTLLQDVVYFALSTLLKFAGNLIKGASDSFGISNLATTVSGYWSMVPADVQGILQAIGIPTALGIVVAGILIRFALQLIPFIRLGS